MTKKFENVLKFLTDPPTEFNSKVMKEYVDILPEMDNGVRSGRDLLKEWLEFDEDTVHNSIDKLSTAAIAMLQYKRVVSKVKDVPTPLREILMSELAKKMVEESSIDTVFLSTLAWTTGFLLGLEFYKSVIAEPDDEES